ncbi:putative photosynthetic complex assembly protein [Loktanella fryxellensis]|uniref:Putative photosynthetic complex assembly protein n=1 Tax=Loktanella fryxellensis TaxID=245187 RepID=A0A1H8CNY4_9RHOB|nr:photosynthetic complex assembly protein PuhC [Loktanella fryxellensis]SEM96619.1 putative photosynthetic complex assembly protein [Loktanella fryxellensis]
MTTAQTRIHNSRSEEMVPRALVVAMFALMLGTLTLATVSQLTDAPHAGVIPASPVVETMEIALIGSRSGAYQVLAYDGTVIAVSDQDKAGFIGVVGRVVERKRVSSGLPVADPVTLQKHDNGTLSIVDASTGMDISLTGYGVDNLAAFARLFD